MKRDTLYLSLVDTFYLLLICSISLSLSLQKRAGRGAYSGRDALRCIGDGLGPGSGRQRDFDLPRGDAVGHASQDFDRDVVLSSRRWLGIGLGLRVKG